MFITKKHISRRTVLRAPARPSRCRFSTRWCRPRRRWRKRRPTRSRDSSAASCRTAWPPAIGFPRRRARWRGASLHLQAARTVSRPHGDHERTAFALRRAASGRDRRRPLGRRGVPLRQQTQEDRRRRRLRRHHHRSDDRAEDRPGQPDALDAARRRRSGRQLQQLRRRLQLHLHQHHLVVHADLAAADGAESAGRVRAHVRRRQHGRAARRAPQAGSAAFSIRSPAASRGFAATSAPPTAPGSTTTRRTSARSSAGCRSR